MKFPFSVQHNIPLSLFSTLRLGGPARYFTRVRTTKQLQEVFQFTAKEGVPTLVIGKGSNALFDDAGFYGLVILNLIDFCHFEKGSLYVGAGYSFARLGVMTAKGGYQGLEFASGIPATVGGAIYMNAGAAMQETQECLKEVEWVSIEGEYKAFSREELSFGYRTSCFQSWKGAIVAARFLLHINEDSRERQKQHLTYRLNTQPYKQNSCGCVFRNPEGDSAGRLIEVCGLKGTRIGGVEVSQKHANFFINTGEGTAKEYLELIQKVKQCVKMQTGIELVEEVKVLPYE